MSNQPEVKPNTTPSATPAAVPGKPSAGEQVAKPVTPLATEPKKV